MRYFEYALLTVVAVVAAYLFVIPGILKTSMSLSDSAQMINRAGR